MLSEAYFEVSKSRFFFSYTYHINIAFMEFTDYKVSYPTFYVIDKGETDKTKGTALAVYPPVLPRKDRRLVFHAMLVCRLHGGLLGTLPHHRWVNFLIFQHMIRTFCHLWSPSTNTLCTSVGEFSISLWDLHVLGGLPLRGLFYDEVVPSAKELTGVDKDNKLFLPRSWGSDSDGVHALDWVKFWFKSLVRYREPPQRLSKKGLTKPQLTYNPSGEIHSSLVHDRTEEENAPFDALGVKEPDKVGIKS
ncbi:hypothetical protein ACJIZ3_023639 [Penstemon smallii]|uniref:Aminotransferase-like plant mobile domain-containing protein n=1 Tax=Penstemon smallii TaxID=265156 RepID=A0ABD3TRK9_9LAMI